VIILRYDENGKDSKNLDFCHIATMAIAKMAKFESSQHRGKSGDNSKARLFHKSLPNFDGENGDVIELLKILKHLITVSMFPTRCKSELCCRRAAIIQHQKLVVRRRIASVARLDTAT
jgi:hypothetical protein